MPELPEVETIRNELAPLVVGRSIVGVTLSDPTALASPDQQEFMARVVGKRVRSLRRRGKYLLFGLSSGRVLIVHLRMTGSLLLVPSGFPGPHVRQNTRVRLALKLDDGSGLLFIDRRRLGRVWLADVNGKHELMARLGMEPLDPAFTPDDLSEALSRRRAPVKAVLCDQKVIAGVGNMYADEALFEAGVHPLTAACEVPPEAVKRLHRSIRRVLRAAISNRGASVDTYLRPDGSPGQAHSEFRVAHRLGEPCPACGTEVERIMIRNRGAYFCPRCQPRKGGRGSGV
ncbi:MAG: bifunctional DNA-formamidopyrimidine glycosylase/DNA-(apurinic or apyrimidinic site) lyase [Chloroflexota bacterium]